METAKLAKRSERKPVRHSSTSAPKRAVRNKAESAPSLPKETGSKSELKKLVCRYCGSDDLVPSLIKRRDRRCRKCFSKRYGLSAPARNARSRNSSNATSDEGPGSKGLGPLCLPSFRSEGKARCDRRCRRCFSKRYGAGAPARKTLV